MHQALRVLTLLRHHDDLTLTEIAETLGIGKSSTYRLLATLKTHRYVDQTATRSYRLGPAMSTSPEAESAMHCAEVAQPHLDALCAAARETVHLCTLNGGHAEFTAVVEPERTLRVTSRLGASVPAHAAAAGKVLLAALPARERGLLYPTAEIAPLTGRTLVSRVALEAEIEAVGRLGFARNVGESEDGVYALGIAIRRPTGRPICSLTIAGPSSRIEAGCGAELSAIETTFLGLLRSAGAAIEAELRF
ncbi:IclR family transcriptional regulator [Actinomycetospora atypica]|uniref:IclR family transcriptional regulator n=1 Tax=Actinomycetospora atypica TaxID=1290095 RepID=A0ABV9YU18_9PSEU